MSGICFLAPHKDLLLAEVGGKNSGRLILYYSTKKPLAHGKPGTTHDHTTLFFDVSIGRWYDKKLMA
jgi:hypothetical protein